jgi:hypothetical protein
MPYVTARSDSQTAVLGEGWDINGTRPLQVAVNTQGA